MAKCVRYDDHAGAGMEQRPEAETCEEAAVLTLATVQGGGGPWRELGDRLPGELGSHRLTSWQKPDTFHAESISSILCLLWKLGAFRDSNAMLHSKAALNSNELLCAN